MMVIDMNGSSERFSCNAAAYGRHIHYNSIRRLNGHLRLFSSKHTPSSLHVDATCEDNWSFLIRKPGNTLPSVSACEADGAVDFVRDFPSTRQPASSPLVF